MEKKKHKFLSLSKKYGRYTMHMTQHIFIEVGRKRNGPVSWVIFLDDSHIVLNTYIPHCKTKIKEDYLDTQWNNFIVKYSYNIDVWEMAEDYNIEKFNEYKDYLLPVSSKVTLIEIDKIMDEVDMLKKRKLNMLKKINKVEDKLAELLEDIKNII